MFDPSGDGAPESVPVGGITRWASRYSGAVNRPKAIVPIAPGAALRRPCNARGGLKVGPAGVVPAWTREMTVVCGVKGNTVREPPGPRSNVAGAVVAARIWSRIFSRSVVTVRVVKTLAMTTSFFLEPDRLKAARASRRSLRYALRRASPVCPKLSSFRKRSNAGDRIGLPLASRTPDVTKSA